MTDHDPLCPRHESGRDPVWGFGAAGECQCNQIARVRADERERIIHDAAESMPWTAEVEALRGALSDSRHWAAATVLDLANAEAVAARLVEVICDMDADAQELIDSHEEAMALYIRATAPARDLAGHVAARLRYEWLRDAARADERERLRAQVPQLPLWGTGLVRVSDVLALLGGES